MVIISLVSNKCDGCDGHRDVREGYVKGVREEAGYRDAPEQKEQTNKPQFYILMNDGWIG